MATWVKMKQREERTVWRRHAKPAPPGGWKRPPRPPRPAPPPTPPPPPMAATAWTVGAITWDTVTTAAMTRVYNMKTMSYDLETEEVDPWTDLYEDKKRPLTLWDDLRLGKGLHCQWDGQALVWGSPAWGWYTTR